VDEVECDNCLADFVPRLTETRVKGGARQRFSCPECGEVYEIAFITTTGLKLRNQLKRLRARGNSPEYQDLQRRFEAEVSRP
jgi:transposase-like protein